MRYLTCFSCFVYFNCQKFGREKNYRTSSFVLKNIVSLGICIFVNNLLCSCVYPCNQHIKSSVMELSLNPISLDTILIPTSRQQHKPLTSSVRMGEVCKSIEYSVLYLDNVSYAPSLELTLQWKEPRKLVWNILKCSNPEDTSFLIPDGYSRAFVTTP